MAIHVPWAAQSRPAIGSDLSPAVGTEVAPHVAPQSTKKSHAGADSGCPSRSAALTLPPQVATFVSRQYSGRATIAKKLSSGACFGPVAPVTRSRFGHIANRDPHRKAGTTLALDHLRTAALGPSGCENVSCPAAGPAPSISTRRLIAPCGDGRCGRGCRHRERYRDHKRKDHLGCFSRTFWCFWRTFYRTFR